MFIGLVLLLRFFIILFIFVSVAENPAITVT